MSTGQTKRKPRQTTPRRMVPIVGVLALIALWIAYGASEAAQHDLWFLADLIPKWIGNSGLEVLRSFFMALYTLCLAAGVYTVGHVIYVSIRSFPEIRVLSGAVPNPAYDKSYADLGLTNPRLVRKIEKLEKDFVELSTKSR